MKPKFRNTIFAFTLTLIVLLTSSCMERTETITVNEDGSTLFRLEFSGDYAEFQPPATVPSPPIWTILKQEIDSSDSDNILMEMEAEVTVPFGQALPETFALSDTGNFNVNLRFPGELKIWREGNLTFYQFRREYQGRKFRCYNLSEEPGWDHELEERVAEKGIFKVSEQDRTDYLDQLITSFGYLHWRMFSETLGYMVRTGEISILTKTSVENKAYNHLEATITPEMVLAILGKNEEAIEKEVEDLERQVNRQLRQILSDELGKDNLDKLKIFDSWVADLKADYELTEMLGEDEFSITLNLPGTIINSNGLYDLQEPGSVEWHFNGQDFHDSNLILYALSAIEN